MKADITDKANGPIRQSLEWMHLISEREKGKQKEIDVRLYPVSKQIMAVFLYPISKAGQSKWYKIEMSSGKQQL